MASLALTGCSLLECSTVAGILAALPAGQTALIFGVDADLVNALFLARFGVSYLGSGEYRIVAPSAYTPTKEVHHE